MEAKFGLEFLFILMIKNPSDIEILLTLQLTIRKSKILVLGYTNRQTVMKPILPPVLKLLQASYKKSMKK